MQRKTSGRQRWLYLLPLAVVLFVLYSGTAFNDAYIDFKQGFMEAIDG